jgi:O-acetylhomoserine (thiol)-lyase
MHASLEIDKSYMTHAQMSEEERLAGGVKQEAIRLSIGLEDIEDLKADLVQAFKNI